MDTKENFDARNEAALAGLSQTKKIEQPKRQGRQPLYYRNVTQEDIEDFNKGRHPSKRQKRRNRKVIN